MRRLCLAADVRITAPLHLSHLGVTVPPDQIPAKDQTLQAKLQGLSGNAFDRTYIKAMVKDHKQDVKNSNMKLRPPKIPT
jgi:putative membrane protein